MLKICPELYCKTAIKIALFILQSIFYFIFIKYTTDIFSLWKKTLGEKD